MARKKVKANKTIKISVVGSTNTKPATQEDAANTTKKNRVADEHKGATQSTNQISADVTHRNTIPTSAQTNISPNSTLSTPIQTVISADTAQTNTVPDNSQLNAITGKTKGKKASTLFRTWIEELLKHWKALLSLIVGTVLTNFITQIQGNHDLFLNILKQYTWLVITVLAIVVITPFISFSEEKTPASTTSVSGNTTSSQTTKGLTLTPLLRTFIAVILPMATTIIFFTLIITILVHPPYCPAFLCPPPRIEVATNAAGTHDQNIEAYTTAIQSNYFVMPGNPQQYSLSTLPQKIAALRVDDTKTGPYRVVLGIHDLHLDGYGMYIENVALLIKNVPSIAQPLNVWNTNSLVYSSAPYSVIYRGEKPGSILSANYLASPNAPQVKQQLKPGETDTIDLQVNVAPSIQQVDLQFQVIITYRKFNEAQTHTLVVPTVFEVVFSDASNWHEYILQNGFMIAK